MVIRSVAKADSPAPSIKATASILLSNRFMFRFPFYFFGNRRMHPSRRHGKLTFLKHKALGLPDVAQRRNDRFEQAHRIEGAFGYARDQAGGHHGRFADYREHSSPRAEFPLQRLRH